MVERFSERNLWPDCVIFVKNLPSTLLEDTVVEGDKKKKKKDPLKNMHVVYLPCSASDRKVECVQYQ